MLRSCLLLSLALLGVQGFPKRLRTYYEEIDPQIVGGNPVTIDQYPFQVSMEKYGSHDCGGSILNKEYVLTAAHCVYYGSASDVGVRYGTSTREQGGTLVPAKWVGYSPEYDSYSHQYDVALIQLSEDIVFSQLAKPTRMVRVGTLPRATDVLTVSGWGTLHSGDYDLPTDLYAVDVPFVPMTVCQISYGERGYLVDDSMVCAGISGKDSCQGDSGGPLINVLGEQVGLVSWGIGCGYPGYAGVYANLGNPTNRAFIQNVTGIP